MVVWAPHGRWGSQWIAGANWLVVGEQKNGKSDGSYLVVSGSQMVVGGSQIEAGDSRAEVVDGSCATQMVVGEQSDCS